MLIFAMQHHGIRKTGLMVNIDICSFFNLFNKNLLNNYYVPQTALGWYGKAMGSSIVTLGIYPICSSVSAVD